MNYGSSTANRPRGLAFSLLGGLYFALASLSVAAAGPVQVTVNPTTGYAEVGPRTYSLPPNARVTPGTGLPSVATTSGAGLRQSFPSGIEITALRDPAIKGSFGLGSGLSASAQALKNAAVRCVTSMKCNLAFAAGAAGLETLFDGVDWVMGPGAEITKNEAVLAPGGEPGTYYWAPGASSPARGPTPEASCHAIAAGNTSVSERYTYHSMRQGSPTFWYCTLKREALSGGVWNPGGFPEYPVQRFGSSCPEGSTWTPAIGACVISFQEVPVPASEIDQKIQSDYVPDPTDWRFILPGLDLAGDGVSIDVSPPASPAATSLPSIQVNPDGSTSESTTSWDFDFLDNPGKQPIGQSTETTTKNDYSPTGEPTGSTTTTTTVTGSAPGATPLPTPPEIPTDCDFMPTVCAFLDWFKEPDPDSSDPYDELSNLVQVYEDPGTTVSIGPFNAVCPAPRTIALSFVPSVEISFQPFCDLAAAVRFWLLAIAYFGAAYVTVRSI